MASIKKINVGGTEYDLGAIKSKVYYGECATAAATTAKVVVCPEMATAPSGGEVLFVYFSQGQSASSMTLNVNSLGAEAVFIYGDASMSSQIGTETGTLMFTYSDSIGGWLLNPISNSDTKVQYTADTGTTYRSLLTRGASNPGTIYSPTNIKASGSGLSIGSTNPAHLTDSQLLFNQTYADINFRGSYGYIIGSNILNVGYESDSQSGTFTQYVDSGISELVSGSEVGGWSQSLYITPNYYHVDNHKVTIATTAPSSPSAGDIWFDISSTYGSGQYAVAKRTTTGNVTLTDSSVTQVVLESIADSYGDIFSIVDGGVQVSQAGHYRINGSVYVASGVGAGDSTACSTYGNVYSAMNKARRGCYLKYGTSGTFSTGTEFASNMTSTGSGTFAVSAGPVVVSLSAGDVVWLACRAYNANNAYYSGNTMSTYLVVEKLPN